MPDQGLVDLADSKFIMDISRERKGNDSITENKPVLVKYHSRSFSNRARILRGNLEENLSKIREEFLVHVTNITKEERVQRLVPDAIKSLEAVQSLNSVRKSPCPVPHFGASKRGNLVLEDANSELETYSTPAVDREEEHWKPVGFDVKEAAILPLVKQYFCDDHDLEYDQFLYPSLEVQPDQVEEASSDSSLPQAHSLGEGSLNLWKKLHWSPFHKDAQFKSDVYSFGITCSDFLTEGKPFETIHQDLLHSILEPGAVGTWSKLAFGVTLMQSNPCNLISSQTPRGATLAAQTLWETACEQGPEFQRSIRDFSSAGTGNDNEAAGLQDFSVGPESPEFGVQTKKRPHPANESGLLSTRRRGRDYGYEEKRLLLQFRLEYLQDPANDGKSHKWLMFATEKMKEKGHVRASTKWRGLWDRLKKSRDALRKFTEGSTAYWDLTMDDKKALKRADRDFPLTFKREWVAAMEKIEKMKPRRAAKKESRRDGQSLASTFTDCLEEPGDEPDSEFEAMDIPTDEEVLSGEVSRASLESHTEIASADSYGPRTEPSRKRSAASAFYDDDLSAQIRSYVNQQIEEALLPLMNALRSREEDEHKHRQKMLALEKEKLALMRQKLECTRLNAIPASVAK